MTRKDPHTGEMFIPKRTNQVFANSANRIAYHNKKANNLRQRNSYINKPLQRNNKICLELMKDKKEETFHKEYLNGKGFDFTVHTHLVELNGQNQFAIYGFTIIRLDKDNIKIVTHD